MEILNTELAWLGGIIDGEGNLYINSKKSKINNARYLDVKVRISGTDMRMIKKISEIYVGLNLRFHFACVNWNHEGWKKAISINTTSQGSCLKLLETVYPYLVNKKDVAETIIKVIQFVKSFPKGGNTVRRNYWDTPEMIGYAKEYEERSAWYFEPSTTTRKANSVFEFGDIV